MPSNTENTFETLIVHYYFKQTPFALSIIYLQHDAEILKHIRMNFVF